MSFFPLSISIVRSKLRIYKSEQCRQLIRGRDILIDYCQFLDLLFICFSFELIHSKTHRLLNEVQSKMLLYNGAGYGWKQYYNLSDIYDWLDQMLNKYPKVLTHYEYGKSYEGRPLRAVKISNKKVV